MASYGGTPLMMGNIFGIQRESSSNRCLDSYTAGVGSLEDESENSAHGCVSRCDPCWLLATVGQSKFVIGLFRCN